MDKEIGMSEREAFDWWKTEQDEAGYKQSEIARLAWQAACKWQREMDAEKYAANLISSAMKRGIVPTLNQGSKDELDD